MKQKLIMYIKKNPRKIKRVLHLYNFLFGRNKLKIKRGNKLEINSALIKKTRIVINGKNNIVTIDDLSRLINCSIHIYGDNNIFEIKNNVYLCNTELYAEDNKNYITIGKHTSISDKTHLAVIEETTIRIGDDCMFSGDIQIRTGDSHTILNSKGERINYSESVIIGNHVWIGRNVIILKGASVADNSIVGAASVVTKKNEEKNTVLAGNPAIIVKNDINWLRERI